MRSALRPTSHPRAALTGTITHAMITVRSLGPDDWQVIRSIRLRALLDAPYAFTSDHEHEASFDQATWEDRATTCHWFVAFDGNVAVGVVGGMPGWSAEPSERELVAMWVAPTHRKSGIGRLLVDRVAEWARDAGATRLCLGVTPGNGRAREAYLRMGLRPSGKSMPIWRDPMARIEIMEQNLR
jgi:GNAT superfamily N-acetyltransferase